MVLLVVLHLKTLEVEQETQQQETEVDIPHQKEMLVVQVGEILQVLIQEAVAAALAVLDQTQLQVQEVQEVQQHLLVLQVLQ